MLSSQFSRVLIFVEIEHVLGIIFFEFILYFPGYFFLELSVCFFLPWLIFFDNLKFKLKYFVNIFKLLVLDRNTWNHITVQTSDYYQVKVVTWNYIIVYKFFV